MNIQRLRYFISATEHLNFTKAAEEFFMAQSAMSQQILNLEKELGVKLFLRNNKTMSLTTAGQIFLEDARNIVKKYDQALEKLKCIQTQYNGFLNISFNGQYERVFLPRLVNQFKKQYPNVQLKIHSCQLNRITVELEQGTSDLVFGFPYELTNNKAFQTKTLFRDTISIAMSKLHPLASKDSINFQDLHNETIIMVQEEDNPRNFERMKRDFFKSGFYAKKIEEVQNFDTMLLMVEACSGISFVPSYIKYNSGPNLKFYSINDQKDCFTHEVAAIYLKSNNNEFIQPFITSALEFFHLLSN